MLSWILLFLVLALVAGIFGFTSLAGAALGIAQILFFVFLVLLLGTAIMHLANGRRAM